MSYRGVPTQLALRNLTDRIKNELTRAGLQAVVFEAQGLSRQPPGIMHNIHIPKSLTIEQMTKVWEIIGRHCAEFVRQRDLVQGMSKTHRMSGSASSSR